MRLVILISDLLHVLVFVGSICPFLGFLLYLLVPELHSPLFLAAAAVPLLAASAAVILFDLQLLRHHPLLAAWRVVFGAMLVLLPPLVGPVIWWGWGRSWVRQEMAPVPRAHHPQLPLVSDRRPAPPAAPLPKPPPKPFGDPRWLTTFEALAPDELPLRMPVIPLVEEPEESTMRVEKLARPVRPTLIAEPEQLSN